MDSIDDEGYEGELQNGVPHGIGKRIRNRKYIGKDDEINYCSMYEGQWIEGKFDGYGVLILYEDEGFWKNGKKHGNCIYFQKDFGTLEGEYINGDLIGHAKMTYSNGDIYEGGWSLECKQGKGKLICVDGKIIEGEWKDDEYIEKN